VAEEYSFAASSERPELVRQAGLNTGEAVPKTQMQETTAFVPAPAAGSVLEVSPKLEARMG
jgi:hypothetical protein